MTRPIRVEFPGALYHVMSRGVGGSTTYRDDVDRIRFLREITLLVEDRKLIVDAFCLMTNHFHLLCETPVGRLGRWMQQLLSRYSGGFNRRHSRLGHLWQARYKAILVEPGEHFLDCSRYIHRNPVRAAMVRCPEEYVWSSYRSLIGLQPAVGWVSGERTLTAAGGVGRYRVFVESDLAAGKKSPFERAEAGIFFGDKQFAKDMRALVREPGRPGDVSLYGCLDRLQPMPSECIKKVLDDVLRDWPVRGRARIQTYLLRRLTLMTGREIARLIGRSEAAVSGYWQGMRMRAAADKGWDERMNELCRRVRQACQSS